MPVATAGGPEPLAQVVLDAPGAAAVLCEKIGDAGLARDLRITSTATFIIVGAGR